LRSKTSAARESHHWVFLKKPLRVEGEAPQKGNGGRREGRNLPSRFLILRTKKKTRNFNKSITNGRRRRGKKSKEKSRKYQPLTGIILATQSREIRMGGWDTTGKIKRNGEKEDGRA